MIKNLSIRLKLFFSFLLITILAIVVSYFGTSSINKNDTAFKGVLNITSRVQSLLEMKSVAYDLDRAVSSFKFSTSTLEGGDIGLSVGRRQAILVISDRFDTWEKEYKKYADLTDTRTSSFITGLDKEKGAIIESPLLYEDLTGQTKTTQSLALEESEIRTHITSLKGLIETAVEEGRQDLKIAEQLAENESSDVVKIDIIASVVAVVVSLVLSFVLTGLIDRPIRIVRDAALLIAGGNLSTKVPLDTKDEIGELASLINQMTGSLSKSQLHLEENAAENKEKAVALEEQMGETERAKKALLNLLEDTRVAEEKADQERNMYLLLLSSIGEGVLVLDTERKVTITNKVAEKVLEYNAQEMVGKRFDELLKFVHANKSPLEETFWDQAFGSKFSLSPSSDVSVIGKNGNVVPIFIIVAPIVDSHTQEFKGVIITFRDVREERALEEARIGFISTASHQLRTPLTSMRWFSEMLLGGDAGALSEEQKHFVERIYQGTDRMIALVNLLLQLARVEAGRVKVEPVPVDLKATTEGVILTTKVNFDNKQQVIDIKTDPVPLPVVPMDQDMLWQVIQNLLSNANRYAPVASTIFVSIIQKDEEIEYSVKDTGIGIPKDQQGRLFEKFFRADNAISAVPEGSGLGLSLVKILVEGWGGKIWFETEENKGTEFHFTIPLTGMQARDGDVKLTV